MTESGICAGWQSAAMGPIQKYQRPVNLATVPPEELDQIASLSITSLSPPGSHKGKDNRPEKIKTGQTLSGFRVNFFRSDT